MSSRPHLPHRFARVRRGGWSIVVAAGVAVFAPAQDRTVPRVGPSAGPRPETLSSSGQFLAHGPVQADRSALVSRAERVREEFATLFDRAEPRLDLSSLPLRSEAKPLAIHLWVQGDARPPLQPRVYRMEGAAEPTLGMVLAGAALADGERFRRETVRLLLAERILRVHPGAELAPRAEIVPAWLFAGVIEALDHLRIGAPGVRFASLFEAGQIMPVEEILTTRPEKLDGASREIFATSACGLVLALLEQPQGPARFRTFLGEIPVSSDSAQTQLARGFPGLALSKHSLEKWWSLQMAQMAQPTAFEPLGAGETDRRLSEALMVHVSPATPQPDGPSILGRWLKSLLPGGKAAAAPHAPTPPAAVDATSAATVPVPVAEVILLTDLDRLMKLPKRGAILAANQAELAVLALRAFPLHRPLLDEYQKVLGLIIRGKTKGLPARLDTLATRRREILAAVDQVEDHLNWYEATQRPQSSGSFDSYFKLLDELAKPPPKSDDPITRYLDEIESEFEAR